MQANVIQSSEVSYAQAETCLVVPLYENEFPAKSDVMDGGDMNPRTPDYARILILDLQGNVLKQWSSYGTEPGQLKWGHDVAVGKDGAVYTAEVRYNNRPQKWVPAPTK